MIQYLREVTMNYDRGSEKQVAPENVVHQQWMRYRF